MTIEQEFDEFYKSTYGMNKKIDEKQKREIKMNFYSGAYRGSSPVVHTGKCYEDCKKWINNYIDERFKEEGLKR